MNTFLLRVSQFLKCQNCQSVPHCKIWGVLYKSSLSSLCCYILKLCKWFSMDLNILISDIYGFENRFPENISINKSGFFFIFSLKSGFPKYFDLSAMTLAVTSWEFLALMENLRTQKRVFWLKISLHCLPSWVESSHAYLQEGGCRPQSPGWALIGTGGRRASPGANSLPSLKEVAWKWLACLIKLSM